MSIDKIKRTISPVVWVPTVYFAMGMPFVVLNMVTALMFKGLGISDAQIAFWTSIIMFPWTIKPLWSPFLEMFKTKKYFVVLTQFCSGIFFGLVALSLQLPHFFAISIALLAVIAFSGATHDVATDGVYMAVLSKEDQAKYIGWQGAFYNVAKLAATGGLVYLAGYLIERVGIVNAWMIIMGCCGAIMLLLGVYHWKMLPSDKEAASNQVISAHDTWIALKDVIVTFFQKKYILLYICFIILYRFAEGMVIKIVPLFMKSGIENGGLGLTEQQIGLYYGSFGAAAFVLGSFEYFGYGFGFVGLTLFMMQQVAPGKHQMAHYAFASGIMNLGVMIPGMMSGILSDWLGYRTFFLVALLAAIPVLILVKFLPFTYSDEKK